WVKDKPACFADIMTWIEKNSPEQQGADNMKRIASATLTDVKIEGDTASGMVKADNVQGTVMKFKKMDGQWYLDMAAELNEPPPGGAARGGTLRPVGAPPAGGGPQLPPGTIQPAK